MGEWVEFPVSKEDLNKVFDRIQICHDNVTYLDEGGNPYEEVFITDYETDIDGFEGREFENIDELNEMAEQVKELEKEQLLALQGVLSYGYSFEEAMEKIQNGSYVIYEGCQTMLEVALQVVDEAQYLMDVPDEVSRYFDYEAFARDLEIKRAFSDIDGVIVEICE